MNVDNNFINSIERNIFSNKFDFTRLEKWKMKLMDIFQSTADHKKLMEWLMKYIEYVINYGCSINDQKYQIAICRTYLGVVEVVVISREHQNAFIQELSHKIFDIVMEEDANSWCIKKELLKVFIKCARKVDKNVRQQTIFRLPRIYLFKLFDSLSTYSDYDLQVLLIETLFCMYGRDILSSKLKDLIPESKDLSESFAAINLDMFYESVRKFLNVLNKTSKKMFSIKCCNIKLGNFICVQNVDELDGPWVNFNLWNNSVSWYCCNSTFDPGDEYDDDPSNYILLFGSDVKTVMVDSSSDRSGLVVTFKLKNPCISKCEKFQNYVDKCDSCYMLFIDSEESRKLVSEILPHIFRKKIVQDGIEQKKVLKDTKGNYRPLKISKLKNTSNISCTTNWICLSATTSPSSKNDILFKDDVVVVADSSLTHTESEDFLAEKSQDQYQTPLNDITDDIISLHSSLSNELLSIHDEMERIQILSGRCSKSNVNLLPLTRNQSKGVSRFSRTITNKMEDIVEENETPFQTARETVMEVFETADNMTHSQVTNCKTSRAINEDVESFNSLKVNIFMDRSSQPISQSGNMIENVDMENNKQEWENDITLNLQTYQAPGIKFSKNTWKDNNLNEAEIKSTKITRKKTEELSGRKKDLSKLSESSQITDKCPKLLMQNERLPGKVSKSKKEDDNTIETVRAKNKSLEEAVALTRHDQSQYSLEEDLPLANSLIQKKKVSKYVISETRHTNMDIHLQMTKKNEETIVSKKHCIFKQKDINKDDDLRIDSAQSEKVLGEKDQAYQHISVQMKNNLKNQEDFHSQNVDEQNTDEILSKTVKAIENMHCPKWIENNEEENIDEMTTNNQSLIFKERVQSTKNVEEIKFATLIEGRVDAVQGGEKEKTEQIKKGRYLKSKKNIVPAEVVEEINSPNCTENDFLNNNSDKGSFHQSENILQPAETMEERNYSKLVKERSDGFESIKAQQAEVVREINSAELNEDCLGSFEGAEKLRTNSPKGINDKNDSFVTLENEKSDKIHNKSENVKSNKEINLREIVSDFVEDNVGGFESADKYKTVEKGDFRKIINKIQPGESCKEMDSPKLSGDSAVDYDNRDKYKINEIDDKRCFPNIENKIKQAPTVEEMDSQKLIKSSAGGLASVEMQNSQYQKFKKSLQSDSPDGCSRTEKAELFDQITEKRRYRKTKNKIQSSKNVVEMNPSKLIAWKDKSDQAPYKTRYQKSKNMQQVVEINKEFDSPKSIKDRSDGFESAKKIQPDKIVDKSLCRKSKKNQLVGITEEMNFSKLIEHSGNVLGNAKKEKIDQVVNNSVHGKIKKIQQEGADQIPDKDQESKKIQLNETVTEIDSLKLIEKNASDFEILGTGGTQNSIESQYKKSKEPISPTEIFEDKESPVLVKDKADETLKQVELSEKGGMILQTKTDHIEEKYSVGNKIDVEISLNKSFETEGVREIVIPLTAIKIGTHDSTVRGVTEKKHIFEDGQASSKSSRKCINRCLAKVEDSSTNSKENECPNIKHQTFEKKSKLTKERQLIHNLEEIVTNTNGTSPEQNGILNKVGVGMENNLIHNKNVCEQISISKKNVLAGSPNLFENVPKESIILSKELLRDVPTESLFEDILEGNQTLDKNILEKSASQNIIAEAQVSSKYIEGNLDIMENVSKSTDVPKKSLLPNKVFKHKSIPEGIFAETSNPTKYIQGKSTVSNKYLTKQDDQTINDNVPSESKQIQILVPKQLLSNKNPNNENNTVFNALLDDYKNELQLKNNVGDMDNNVATTMHNKPINPKIKKVEEGEGGQMGVVAEQSLDAIQQFIEASFDRSTKDSNQTLSTTVSGKRKLRKLYTPGDLSFIDIIEKRPVAVTEINKKSSVVENKAVEVKTIAVDCSLSQKREITILDEQLKHVTKSTLKKRKLPRAEAVQLQPIEECVTIKKKKTFLDEEVDKSRKTASKKQKVTQSLIQQSKLSEKHNATEEKRTRLKSSFRDMLESFRQETGITSVIEYVRKPKMQDKRKTRGKPPAHITKSKCNNRKFSMDRVMRTEKLDLSNSSSSSLDLRAPRKIVKQLAPTPPTPLPDPPEAIPVVPIEADTKKIHVISNVLLVPGPVPKKKQRLMSVVESSLVEGGSTVHLESKHVNNGDEDQISMSIDNYYGLVSHLAPDWRGTAIVDRDYISIGSKDYLGKYLILFFYPLDFGRSEIHEPTDVIALSKKVVAFRNLNCEVVACSVDHYWTHLAWSNQLEGGINFPILADPTHVISNAFGVYMKDTGYTYRSSFLINPNGIITWQETIGVQYEMNIERILQIVQYVQSRDT